METKEVLKQCTVDGMIVRLPAIKLERKEYQDVAKQLELIGGKWKGGKIAGFVFNEDPTEMLEQIASGEKRNLKKEFQFFGTPSDLADDLIELADIKEDDVILEPSAGQGAIINAIHKVLPTKNVNWCELMPLNQTFVRRINNTTFICEDFLKHDIKGFYDKIIANPPFSKNQDIEHIMKMWDALKSGGRIVTVASRHWRSSSNKKETAFRAFLDSVNAEIIDIDAGKFKDSGTMIATVILVINKA